MADRRDAAERILESTIRLIGEKGTMDVSVREIARAAEVNVAAINYYFETKERMLTEMREHFLGNYARVNQVLYDDSVAVEQRLRSWADDVMFYLLQFPGILVVVAQLVSTELPDAFESMVREQLDNSFGVLRRAIGEMLGSDDEALLNFRCSLLIAAITQPVTQPEAGVYRREQFEDPQFRKRYVDRLFDCLKV